MKHIVSLGSLGRRGQVNVVYERDVNRVEFNRDFFTIEISGQGLE